VVQGADFRVNPVTVRYPREQASESGLLQQPECAALIIVTLDELEALDGVVNTHPASAASVLRGYVAGGATDSLRNHIHTEFGGSGVHRSRPIQDALDTVLSFVVHRLSNLKPIPADGDGVDLLD
jgi:hypothetical protein